MCDYGRDPHPGLAARFSVFFYEFVFCPLPRPLTLIWVEVGHFEPAQETMYAASLRDCAAGARTQ